MRGRKTGGRTKGTPNKVNRTIKAILAEQTSDYYNSEEFKKDLKCLEPRDRLVIMEKLTSYIVPKMQSTTIDATVASKKTIEDKLIELSSE